MHEEATKWVETHSHVCCTRMVDWMVTEGRKAFKGTTAEHTWASCGDGLAQWWDKGTQDYFEKMYPKEFKRQIRALGDVNAKFAWYRGRLVGNSPEFMPLDSNLFADLERLLIIHRALTYEYDAGDERRFSLGTPKQCESAVERCWTMLPDHRIVRDCDRWAEAYQIVNDHDGKVVRGWGRVTGRRSGKDRGEPAVPTAFHSDAADGVKALMDLA